MKISELTKGMNVDIVGFSNIEISGISFDSRKVSKGNIFAALHGSKDEGKKYIKDAIFRGAIAILTDDNAIIEKDATYIISNNVSEALGVISSRFYNEPSKKMKVFAITGTNGKTTITYLIEKIFKDANINLGVIGTILYRFGDSKIPAPNTTPLSPELHELLANMRSNGADGVVMEASSHSLVQNRISGCDLDVAIFTNLTRDHLDYHNTMEEYEKAKSLLFNKFLKNSSKDKKYSIINIDDASGRNLVKEAPGILMTYGIKTKADFRASDIIINKDKTEFIINTAKDKIKIETKLIGKHNIYNILAAFICAYCQNINIDSIVTSIKEFESVPGRFESINIGQPFTVIVDYAHTPDALGNLIMAAKTIKHRKIIMVFGCGGDRDRTKRPLMGEISARMSDYSIITSDNPRSEKPERIALDIEVGFQRIKCKNYEVIVDRTSAIEKAISICEKDDILLIAGKGHEDYQVIGDVKIPYNDKDVVISYLGDRVR